MTAFLVDTAAGVGRRALQVTEQEAFTATHRVAVLHAAAEGEGQLAALGDLDIEVRAVVQSLEVEGLVLVVREGLEQGVLVQEAGGHEVADALGTAVHVHIGLLLPRGVVHDVLDPVHVRERAGHVAEAEVLHDVLGEPDAGVGVRGVVGDGRGGRPLGHRQRIGDGGVVPHLAVGVGIGEVDELRDRLHGGIGGSGHGGLAHGTTLGGHEDDAVRAADTEHGGRGRVLQDGDALDFVRIQLREGTLDAVHEDERLGAVQGSDTTDADDGFIGARHTRRLHGGHAREVTLQGVRDVRHRGLHQSLAAHRGNRTGDGNFLLLAVRDDHGLVQGIGVGFHVDGHPRRRRDRQGLVAHTRELERGPLGHGQREVTVHVGDRSGRGPLYDHARSDQTFSQLIQHPALYAQVLGERLSGKQEQKRRQQSEQLRQFSHFHHDW